MTQCEREASGDPMREGGQWGHSVRGRPVGTQCEREASGDTVREGGQW